jgi:hypothetical protein
VFNHLSTVVKWNSQDPSLDLVAREYLGSPFRLVAELPEIGCHLRFLLPGPDCDVDRLLDCIALIYDTFFKAKIVQPTIALMLGWHLLDILCSRLILDEPKDVGLPLMTVPDLNFGHHSLLAPTDVYAEITINDLIQEFSGPPSPMYQAVELPQG